MKTDIEIAQSVELKPITEVVEKVGIGFDDLELYGKYKAKLSFDKIKEVKDDKPGKLILVTAINPTPAGVAGNSAAPFNYGVCPCHAAVQRSRDLVATQRASTIATIDRTAAAIVCSKDIAWAGPASEEFRARLDEFRSKAALLADDMEATHRLVWGSA